MVLTLLLPARAIFKLQDIITPQHVDKMAKIILLTGSIRRLRLRDGVLHCLVQRQSLRAVRVLNRVFGPYWWYWWVGMLFCNVLSPQLFWFRWCRHNIFVVFFVCMCVNAGMWFERFIIIVGGLLRDFLPSSWGVYHPTWVEIWTFIGTIRNFHFAVPAIHPFPADDRDVGSEDRPMPEADPHYRRAPEHQPVAPGGRERTR